MVLFCNQKYDQKVTLLNATSLDNYAQLSLHLHAVTVFCFKVTVYALPGLFLYSSPIHKEANVLVYALPCVPGILWMLFVSIPPPPLIYKSLSFTCTFVFVVVQMVHRLTFLLKLLLV